jgi:hypothetical protein
MRLSILSAVMAVAAGLALAEDPQKSVLVSYPQDTPSSVVGDAIEAFKSAVSEAKYCLYSLLIHPPGWPSYTRVQ